VRWALLAALVLTGPSLAQTNPDRAWLERSATIRADPGTVLTPEEAAIANPLPPLDADTQASVDAIAREARAEVDSVIDAQAQQLGDPSVPVAATEGPRILVFLSQSLGEGSLRSHMDAGRGRRDEILTFRGLEPGQKLAALQQLITRLLGKITEDTELPTIAIDPAQFDQYAIDVAPTLVYLDAQGREMARVRGQASAQ
jgi:hypothetical protein